MKKLVIGIFFISSCLYAQVDEQKSNAPIKTPEAKYGIFPINTGITTANQTAMIKELRYLLADNYVLYTKALNFHWNVEGELFSQLHEFFKKLYEDLQATNDLLAERIRALGAYSPGSLQEFLSLTQLKENSGSRHSGHLSSQEMLQTLLNDFETVIRSLRKATELSADKKDWGSNNMLAGLLEKQEKNAWMIRAHLQK